jgi:Polyketide cyclase / dehydrase and lipid transport
MSMCRQQGFVEAPVEVVWELISDVERHPEWWPRVIEVECEGLDEGCTYRQLTQTPIGKDEMNLLIENRDEMRNLRIRCINTGTFVSFAITGAQDGTFVDGEMGMDPRNLRSRLIDMTVGKRYFTQWLDATLEALREVGAGRARGGAGEVGDPGLEPGTSSLSETRSNQLS